MTPRSIRPLALRAVATATGALVVGSLTVAPASAATLVGATAAPLAQICPAPNTVVPTAASAAQYTVPTAGVITSWRFQASANVPTLKLKVFRASGGSFTVTGSSAAVAPVAATLNSFDERIPVAAGDIIGLALLIMGECTTSVSGTFGYAPGDAAVGSTPAFSGTTGTLDVAAIVEPDADGDGYGDETQDGCPSQAASHGTCLPSAATDKTAPDSRFTAGPKRTTKSTAKFAFTSDDPGARFECRLTGKQVRTIEESTFGPCTSPKKFKHLRPGKYQVSVRAIDAVGNVEAVPATVTLKVEKKKR